MKSITINQILILVSISLFVSLVLAAPFQRNIETSIVIEASPEQVWEAIAGFEQYPNWSPFIRSIQGELTAGEQLRVEIAPAGKDVMLFTPEVLVADANRELRWVGKLGVQGVFDGEHYFKLEPLGDNRTRLVHGEDFSGLLMPAFWQMIVDSTLQGFNDHNRSLKIRVENSAV